MDQMKTRGAPTGRALASLLIILGLVAPVSPQEPKAPAESEKSKATVTIGSMQVGVDPSTGELRPLTKAEAQQLASEMRKKFPPRTVTAPTVRPDGALSATVMPNVLRLSVVKIGSDGRGTLECTGDPEKAIDFLTSPAMTAEKPEVQR